jgi:hypothetical protein
MSQLQKANLLRLLRRYAPMTAKTPFVFAKRSNPVIEYFCNYLRLIEKTDCKTNKNRGAVVSRANILIIVLAISILCSIPSTPVLYATEINKNVQKKDAGTIAVYFFHGNFRCYN